jgi:hypothetical protein
VYIYIYIYLFAIPWLKCRTKFDSMDKYGFWTSLMETKRLDNYITIVGIEREYELIGIS